jgi:hypothetical protein
MDNNRPHVLERYANIARIHAYTKKERQAERNPLANMQREQVK